MTRTFRGHRFQRRALTTALSAAMLVGGAAYAQEPVAGEEGAEASATDFDAIVVTARKRAESVMEVPMNISVISAEEINIRNLGSVQDIYRTVAGGVSPTGELILRGLVGGNTAVPGTTTQFVDGIPFGFGSMFDIEQVEVLRGPQGTLWGSNAIGGTVQIITRKPQMNEFEVYSTITGEQEKSLSGIKTRTQAGINIPLVQDQLAMRMAASVSHTPGKIVNAHTGNRRKAEGEFLRTQLQWEPTADFRANFGHIYTESTTRGTLNADRSVAGYYWVPSLEANPDSPWGYDVDFDTVDCPDGAERPACLTGGAPRVKSDPKYTVYELFDGWSKNTTNLFSLRLDHDDLFGIASASYIGSYRKNFSNSLDNWSRLDMEDMMRTWIINRDSEYRTTHELRFQSLEPVGGFDWTVGVFQDRTWSGYNPNVQWQYHESDPQGIAIFSAWNDWAWPEWEDLGIYNIAQLGEALYGNSAVNYNLTSFYDREKEFAAFGETSYVIETGVGDFEITGGIRYFKIEDASHSFNSGIWFGPEGSDNVSEGRESGNRKKFSLAWMPSSDMNIYALYSEAYRAGGNNFPVLPNACLDDEFAPSFRPRYNSDSINNHEIGFKGNLFDRRLRISSAVYHIDWGDTWAPVYMPSCGFTYITNTEGYSAKSQGVEFESSLALGESTMLTFNFGHTKSKMTVDNPAIQASAGDDMTMVPKYNGYLALDHGFNLFGRQAFARVDVATYGSYKSHFNTRDEDLAPSYTTVNLSGRMHLNDHTTVGLYVNNLFNEDYITYRSARTRTATGVNQRNMLTERYGAERSIAVRFDYSFW